MRATQALEWKPYSLQDGPTLDVVGRCWVIDGYVDSGDHVLVWYDAVEQIFYRQTNHNGPSSWEQLRLPARPHKLPVR